MMKNLLALILALTSLQQAAQKHVFYLHGRIVEVQGPNAVDSTNGFGAYQYFAIIDSLKNKGFTVISEVRHENTDVRTYAGKVAGQIRELIGKGIPPGDISVIGASKGTVIAMLVSTILKNKEVNFVLMAACSENNLQRYPDIDLHGRILSVYERSDGYGSCEAFRKRSAGISAFKEIQINTGLRHGFLYRPLNEWMVPATTWCMGASR